MSEMTIPLLLSSGACALCGPASLPSDSLEISALSHQKFGHSVQKAIMMTHRPAHQRQSRLPFLL